MRKNGFTLAETLVTIGIIGIAATLVSPSLKNLLPNKEKIEFMECYKQITTILPTLDTRPKDHVYNYGVITPKCKGLKCVNNIPQKITEALGDSPKYIWKEGTRSETNGYPQQIKKIEFICQTPSKKTFTFTVDGFGSIKELDDNGKKYMKDQFNYFDDGEEETTN